MLVTLEGIDGAGKSSAVAHLRESDRLPAETVFTQEPTDSWYGDAVERSIGDPDADSLAELFLYTADHAAHLAETVRPALADGRVVISDRYSDSRYAYQAATLADYAPLDVEDPLAYVQKVHALWTRVPDATLFLDIDPETGVARAGASNKMEQVAFLETVRENYLRLVEEHSERFVRIDADRKPEAVRAAVENTIVDLVD